MKVRDITFHDEPPQMLPSSEPKSMYREPRESQEKDIRRTAVSSRDLSSESTLPPGNDVSPAYVLSDADRLFIPHTVQVKYVLANAIPRLRD